MTQADFLASDDPSAMLQYLTTWGRTHWRKTGEFSDRKLRLFAAAVARLAAPILGKVIAEDVATAERYADGLATEGDLAQARIASDLWCCDEDARLAADTSARILPGAVGAALLRDIVGNSHSPPALKRPLPWLVVNLAEAAYGERLADGTLDQARLAVLSDALEEAGCVETSDEPVPYEYACEKCGDVLRFLPGWSPSYRRCSRCGSESLRALRRCDLPHPIIDHLRIGPSSIHSPRCRSQFRGCAPECPKDRWERNGSHVRGCWCVDLVLGKS